MRRYNIINNTLGWFCFLIAALTYLLTIEPTASFWDCPEFITQGYKLEVGHPPGNPIFMLTARFFVTIFGGGAEVAAVAVNSMSAILSAATILLLFWTITHLAKKLMVRKQETEVSLIKTVVIMAAGLCGALAYTWSDTFWFSAVEGEVYAFSSFCTALVFWLILKWENRADNPRSDRYLILIAYVIGISIAVHLLNLLCIPAIVLVFYYRKFKNTNVAGSLISLGISFVIVALILFGLVPGFVSVSQRFEVFFVNVLHFGYNIGVLVYAIFTVAVFIWTVYMLHRQKSAAGIKFGFLLSIFLSGMPFIGHGWVVPAVLLIALIIYLYGFCPKVPIRIFNVIILSIFVIFIGYSSYALLLIRSTAYTPMNQNEPDNVFALGSYLNREQYGDTPLLTGPKFSETISFMQYPIDGEYYDILLVDENGNPITQGSNKLVPTVIDARAYDMNGVAINNGYKTYTKVVKTEEGQRDEYIKNVDVYDLQIPEGMSTVFPRMYSDNPTHVRGYKTWSLYSPELLYPIPGEVKQEWAERGFVTREELNPYINYENTTLLTDYVGVGNRLMGGSVEKGVSAWQPSFWDSLKYFFNYQLNHMYWRYFMWNFAGRQNDIQGNGEPHIGNWISGYSFIDTPRLGDQSLLPEEYTTGNAGHNVFYMLPLLLGLIGLLWQSLMKHPGGEKRGIEQFWVIFFLFFMTGIAIVLYLNQTPGQPRERDYAFAGSFYAFAIWIGLGVSAIYSLLVRGYKLVTTRMENGKKEESDEIKKRNNGEKTAKWVFAGFASLVAIAIPLQMVSQTWDDHDRSGRYTTRDFGFNYLNSLDENAIIFVNGDNDTFPLWYAQEVEGVRTDVKVVNLSYLTQDWYARQVASDTYDAKGVPFYMPFSAMDYGSVPFDVLSPGTSGTDYGLTGNVTAEDMLRNMYKAGKQLRSNALHTQSYDSEKPVYLIGGPNIDRVYVPLDANMIEQKFGLIPADDQDERSYNRRSADGTIFNWDITPQNYLYGGSGGLSSLLTYDIIARSASEGFKRPVYFATTVGDSYYMGFARNMYSTGMAMQVTPFNVQNGDASPLAAKAYDNIIGKFRWGGLDSGKKIYLDETVRRMVTSTRLAVLKVANDLLMTPTDEAPESARKISAEKGLPVPANYADMARNLLNYMEAKMPPSQAPYENALSVRLAQVYIRLGADFDSRADLEKARALITDYLASASKLLSYNKSLKDWQRDNFLRNERISLIYAMNALSMLSYIDLEIASQEGKLPEEYDYKLDVLKHLMLSDDDETLLVQENILMIQPSLESVAKMDDYNYAFILETFEGAQVDLYKHVNEFLKKSGVSKKELWEWL